MSAVVYKTEQEIQKMGFDILYQGLGASDFIWFMQQWQKDYSVDAILAEMNNLNSG